jgi:hypothetical protein
MPVPDYQSLMLPVLAISAAYLTKAGLLESTRRGHFRITEQPLYLHKQKAGHTPGLS